MSRNGRPQASRRRGGGIWLKRDVYYTRVRGPDGRLRAVSLRTKDHDEAVVRRAQLEEGRHAPWHPSGGVGRTLAEALEAAFSWLELEQVVKPGTVSCYRQRGAHLTRLLGDASVYGLERGVVEEYVRTRLSEGASRHTVVKELSVLRRVLGYAQACGWTGPLFAVETVVPRFSAKYQPRTRAPTPEEVARLLPELQPKRWPYVLLAYSGLRHSEVEAARWCDLQGQRLRVRGTKTRHAKREVLLHPEVAAYLEARRGAPDKPIAERWTNVRRDLARACRRAGIERLSPNDLRRGAATALRAAGAREDVVGQHLGHAPGSRVTAAVYIQPPRGELVEVYAKVASPLPAGATGSGGGEPEGRGGEGGEVRPVTAGVGRSKSNSLRETG